MGAARRRRLALIKAGQADVARTVYAESKPFVQETVLVAPKLADLITERYEHVKKETCRTRADFLEKLLLAGLESFDRYRMSREPAPLVTIARESDIPPIDEDIVRAIDKEIARG